MKHKTPVMLLIALTLLVQIIGGSVAKNDNIEKYVLSNGLTVVLNEQHSRDIISLCLFVDGGSRIESPEVSGISHFIEHLVFRGPSQNLEELQLRRNFRLHGDFSGYTSNDITCYGFTTRPDSFDTALDEFVDGVMNLTIPDSVIEKERSVVTREIHQRIDVPNIRIWELFQSTIYKIHPYRHPVIGYENIIANLPSDTFRDYYHEHYTPDNFIIAITGDFDSAQMVSRIEGAFSGYQPSGKDFERGMHDPPQTEVKSAIEKADVTTMHLLTGWRIPPAKSDVTPGMDVLAEILGGGQDSRFYRKLVTETALVDEISCFTISRHDENQFMIYIVANEENMDSIHREIESVIKSINENPPNSDEITRAKNRLINDHSFRLQTFWDMSQYLARWEILGNLEMGINWPDLIEQVKSDCIKKAAEDYLDFNKRTWVALVPVKKAEEKKPEIAGFNPPISLADIKPGDTVSQNLANGAKVIFKMDTASDIVGVCILAGFGQVMEPSQKRGIGEVTARMLLKGCAEMDSVAFRKKSEELGVEITSSANRDFINVSMQIRKDRLRDGLELVSKVLFNPTFDQDELNLVKDELKSEIERRGDSPYNFVNDKFFEQIYGDTPYGCPVIGRITDVETITVDDIKNFHATAFNTGNLVIGIAGDLNLPEWWGSIEKFFGRLFNATVKIYASDYTYPVNEMPAQYSDEKLHSLARSQVSFNLGEIGISADNPDYHALKLIISVLGLRMFDRYVYELGWSYRMWFYMPTRRGPAPIMFEMGVEKVNFDEAQKGLVDAMKEIIANPISNEELEKTRQYALQNFYLGMEKSIDTAFNLAFYEKVGIGYQFVDEYGEVFSELTPSDLSNVAKKYFHPDKLKLVAIVPSE